MLIACCIGMFIYSINTSTSEAEDINILLTVVGAAWFVGLSVVISYFYNITDVSEESDGFLLKLKKKTMRFFSWLIALFMSVTGVALIYLSYKALGFYLTA